MHTQAFMIPKACLSQPHLLPLCLASLPWCPQPRGPPAAPLPRWGWGDLELWGSCYLPSCIRGGSCRGLIPVSIGAIKSDPPSLLLCEELVSLAGAVGQRPLGSTRDRAPPSGGRRWEWTETLGPGRISSQQTTEQAHSASDSPHPLLSVGLLFVTSEASCSTERRKV